MINNRQSFGYRLLFFMLLYGFIICSTLVEQDIYRYKWINVLLLLLLFKPIYNFKYC